MGGYTSLTWNHLHTYKADEDAWLFNIKAPKIFKVMNKVEAIDADQHQGPSFGRGHDLQIADNSDQDDGSYSAPSSYDYNESGNLFLSKEKHVKSQTEEVEVYVM